MFLNDFNFILFYIAVIILLLIVQFFRKYNNIIFKNIQIIWILLISYIFVSSFDLRFGINLLVETLVAYFSAILIKRSKNKKLILTCSIIILCLILGYFKYCDFFINSIREILNLDTITLNIFLPIGISFYTFTTISYIIDVYKEKIEVEKNFIDFALYIAFFPKIISGPIVRANDFLPQIKNYIGISKVNFSIGIQYFVIGLFKKIVLADRLGIFVNDIFFAPTAYDTFTVIFAVLSYSLQIYFDFAGYTDMAIGISKILGFDIPNNFNLPYIAKNISEFWKRWHISLSSWLKDYLYIPLGGSRKGILRTYINLILVMLISGLWHGAGITFIIWGLLHGIASALNKLLYKESKVKFIQIINIVFTFIMVTLFWVVFRAENISNAIDVYKSMFTIHTGLNEPYYWTFFAIVIFFVEIIISHIKRNEDKYINVYYIIFNFNNILSYTLFFIFIGLTIIMGYFGDTAFIYGKF